MKLFLENGIVMEGQSFGAQAECEGEVVFTTGMSGYLEVLTDPSYFGQIVCFTFPLIGNYGVFQQESFLNDIDRIYESHRIWARGVLVAEHSESFSHALGKSSFAQWLQKQKIPALSNIDTRALTQILREHGTILGKIGHTKPKNFHDPLKGRFVPEVSPQKMEILEPKNSIGKTIAFLDCGAKNGIFRNFLRRGVRVLRLPFDQNPFELKEKFDGLFLSNGPGDPETVTETIEITRQALQKNIPIFGICLGNQILARAAGGKTKKMKYGHRGVNQPVTDLNSGSKNSKSRFKRCLITTQNHGFEVDASSLPSEFKEWMINLNDQSNEGIRHKTKPVFSVQFHPEACAGPEDAQYLFDEFIATL